HWLVSSPADSVRTARLPGAKQDLLIVGGGLTGLWSAYCARRAHPDWGITIVEAEHIDYGASGRNGGWLSTLLPGNRTRYAEAGDSDTDSGPSVPRGASSIDGVTSGS